MSYYIIIKNPDGTYATRPPIALTRVVPAVLARAAVPAVAVGDILVPAVAATDTAPARPARLATVARAAIPAVEAVEERTIDTSVPVAMTANVRVLTQDTMPTQDEILAAFGDDALTQAKGAKAVALYASAHAAVMTIFASLPVGVQAQFAPVNQAADAQAKVGNITAAAAIISTAVVPDALTTAQAGMVSALDPYITLAATLTAATTVDEVAAITIP